VLLAMPLLIPWNVVGTIWQIFARGDIGLLGYVLTQLGIDYNYSQHPTDAWVTVLVMDVWHWTPLVRLLSYAALRAIPSRSTRPLASMALRVGQCFVTSSCRRCAVC
jgi:glycerol transport system permease protein